MFLPQVQENDVYTKDGQQVDDINSVLEFIAVQLGVDKTPDDEDDDSGQNFHLVKAFDYNFEQQYILIEREDFVPVQKHTFSEYKTAKLQLLVYDILTPPPESV